MSRRAVDSPTMKLILRDLALGPATRAELEHVTGAHKRVICRHMQQALEAGLVHIKAYERGRGGIRLYALGKGKNAPRSPLSGAEKRQRWRNREKEKKNAIAALQT
jgi:DNA-binding transcriptional ArsR family regulator